MNTQLIRERVNSSRKGFFFRLSDGTRVQVAHPDFVAVAPGQVVVIDSRTQGITRVDPLHVVAIEEEPPKRPRSKSKRSR
jgi:hypothetical protein